MQKNITFYNYEDNNLLFENTTTAIIEDNIITFHTDNETIKINLEHKSLTKMNNESIFKITEQNCSLMLIELNKTFDIEVLFKEFLINDEEIKITYQLETQEKPFTILIKIGSDINEI